MATVLRVKRRNDDEPLDALIIACKRRKTEGKEDPEAADSNVSLTAVVKFAGTVQNQEENVAEHLTKTLTKDQLKANYKQHVVDIANKSRLQTKEDSKESRYKVVNCFRSVQPIDIEEIDDKGMTVIDVEDSASCSPKESVDDKGTNYVYDLYYTLTEDNLAPDDVFSVFLAEQQLFNDYRDNDVASDHGESEDSNSESNWRNDYPDSDHSENSIDDEDMRHAVGRVKLDGEDSDLSSENSDFVYSVDEADVDNMGYRWAKLKAQMAKELGDIGSEDENEFDGVEISEVHSDEEEDEEEKDDMQQ